MSKKKKKGRPGVVGDTYDLNYPEAIGEGSRSEANPGPARPYLKNN
jgi:hypothetical protein